MKENGVACRRGGALVRSVVAALVMAAGVGAGHAGAAQGDAGITPAELIRAYDFGPLYGQGIRGQGQTIAFIEVDGVAQQDLDSFDSTFHLPSTALQVFVPSGTNGQLAPGGETSLDVEYAHALAPAARLQVYEVTRSGEFQGYSSHLADAIKSAVAGGATVISLSLRGTGSILCSTFWAALHLHGTLQTTVSRGIAVFAASGDYGDRACQGSRSAGTVYPASDPYVTSVGGTYLRAGPGGSYQGETAWSGSGGGISKDFSRPSWQTGSPNFGRYRSVPDVAFDADPRSGVPVYLQGQWQQVGGTSLGAPCWAALWALAEQYQRKRSGHALGQPNPLLYGLANSPQRTRLFHDVTAGSNGQYQAGPGWDDVTGWGSPDAANLVRALAS